MQVANPPAKRADVAFFNFRQVIAVIGLVLDERDVLRPVLKILPEVGKVVVAELAVCGVRQLSQDRLDIIR